MPYDVPVSATGSGHIERANDLMASGYTTATLAAGPPAWAVAFALHGHGGSEGASIQMPGEAPQSAVMEYCWRFTSADGTLSWAATLHFAFKALYWDEEAGGINPLTDEAGENAGLGTPNGRPHHLRQIHGGYVVSFAGDITASATATIAYDGVDENNDPLARTATVTDTGVYSTLVGGVRAVLFDPLDPEDRGAGMPRLSYFCAHVYNPPALPAPDGVEYGTLEGTLTGCTADLGGFNEDLPGVASRAVDLTVTCLTGDSRGDGYDVAGDGRASVVASSKDWANATIALKGYPIIPGGVRAGAYASNATYAGTRANATGPARTYGWSRPDPPDGWEMSTGIGFTLDAARLRDQAHGYGATERLWARPPDIPTWIPFSITHVESIAVDDFTSAHADGTVNNLSGGDATYYTWNASDLGTGGSAAVAGGYRVATVGTGAASPTLSRRWQSDWADMAANPSAYRDDVDTPADVADYIGRAHSGDLAGGVGAWYNVRRKVRTGADTCNWGNHRWLKVRGKASATGLAFTLRIHADSVTLTDNFRMGELSTNAEADESTDERVITATAVGVTVDVPGLEFGVADTDVYVDLAEAAYRVGCSLAHVRQVDFLLPVPTSGTHSLSFDSLTLCSGFADGLRSVDEASPGVRYMVGVPYADDLCVLPVVDGRVTCLQDTMENECPYVLTAVRRQDLVTEPLYTARGADETKTMAELAYEVSLQEGFTVSAVNTPAAVAAFPWALFLDAQEGTDGALTATVKCREIQWPALLAESGATCAAKEVFGGALYGLALDADAHWPESGVSVDIDGAKAAGYTDEKTVASDPNGQWRSGALPLAGRGLWQDALDEDDPAEYPYYRQHRVTAAGLTVDSAPVVAALTLPNRAGREVVLSGTPAAAPVVARGVALAVCETGFMARAFPVGANVRVQRRTLDGGAWETIGERAGKEPGLWWAMDGALRAVINDAGTVKRWSVEDNSVVTLGTGSWPQGCINDAGSFTCVSWWRAGRHRVKVYDGQGNDLYGEITVQGADVAEGPMSVQYRSDGTLEGQYLSGTGIVQVTSPTGEAWT